MPSARLVAFLEELEKPYAAQKPRAEALILRVPGEGQPPLAEDEERAVLMRVGDGLIPPVQAWVRAVQQLAEVERGWGPADRAREAARAFAQATEDFLAVWEQLLRIQPATEPMKHVLGLIHVGCYEFFLSGPDALWRSCKDIAERRAGATLTFHPEAPSLRDATHELRRLQGAGN